MAGRLPPWLLASSAYTSAPGCSFAMTERRFDGADVGKTHASRVIPTVKSSKLLSAIVTRLPVPLNDSALPYRPAVVQVAPVMVPVFPLPDTSATVGPAPALKL